LFVISSKCPRRQRDVNFIHRNQKGQQPMQPVIETEPIEETLGDDWIWPLELLDEDDNAIDLTGCGFEGAAIKWSGGSLPLTLENGRLGVNAEAGAVTVTITRADTALVPAGKRSRAVLPIVDSLNQKSTLLIIPVKVIVP
jgi:hypothetical protein